MSSDNFSGWYMVILEDGHSGRRSSRYLQPDSLSDTASVLPHASPGYAWPRAVLQKTASPKCGFVPHRHRPRLTRYITGKDSTFAQHRYTGGTKLGRKRHLDGRR